MEEMADYSGIDVQVTSDGVVVLCHDLDLKRVAGVSRRLQDMTWEEAKELDVGSYFSKAYKGGADTHLGAGAGSLQGADEAQH